MRKSMKLWGKHIHESLKAKLEEGTSSMEQNFDPSLYLQVIRELMELYYKQLEVRLIAGTIGSYQNEKFDEAVEWINEVDKFTKDTNQEKPFSSLWGRNMLLRIRKIRAFVPNFTFQDVRSSSMATLSLHEKCYYEITSLIKIHCSKLVIAKYTSESDPKVIAEVGNFLEVIKVQLEEKIPETNSDWYYYKLAETRMLISKYEPVFSLQSQDVRSSSIALLSLHEELCCEIRSLISVKCADLMAVESISTNVDLEEDKVDKELHQERINEVNEFLTMIKLELEGNLPEKNSDWFSKKIAETKKLITRNYPAFIFLSQDVGVESKEPGYTKEQYLTSSLQNLQLEEGPSNLMMEQNFNPLYLQTTREWVELLLKQAEERHIDEILGSYHRRYQNEKFYELMEWIDEVDKFIAETSPEMSNRSFETDSDWCKNTMARIRKLHAKHGPNLSFQRARDAGSSSINMSAAMEQHSLREEFCCEITSLIQINFTQSKFSNNLDGLIDEVDEFLVQIRRQLGKVPETNSYWCLNMIAETKALIAKWEPAFSLQSQDVRSSPIALLSLHEELRCEIRSLISMKLVDYLLVQNSTPDYLEKYEKELQKQTNEVNKFLTEINLKLEEKIPQKSSDWYRKKIAETRTLIAKRFSAFPLLSQDVEHTKEDYHIFLSFRGEDTRYGFTRNLYDALRKERFKIFMDDEGLQRGDSISQVLMRAIENSKLSIIVFSENYADSSWCLKEVGKILECKQKNDQLVWPIFYKVDPSDVRHQRNCYEKAMIKQEIRYGKDSEKVKKWRSSLSQICDLKAFHYKENSGYERAFIQDIIKDAMNIRDRL